MLFGLFSGQPLILLGSTGPVYVFERILYKMCQDQTWDYLSLRLWIGLWVAAFLILMVAFDASAYVCYITRCKNMYFKLLRSFCRRSTKNSVVFNVWLFQLLRYPLFQIHRRVIRHSHCFHIHFQCLQEIDGYTGYKHGS